MQATGPRYVGKLALAALLLGLVAACAGPQTADRPAAAMPQADGAAARIEVADKPLQCVPYARAQSGIEIYGNAWTWWQSAKGQFRRDRTPQRGAVLVLSRSAHTRFGHLAVVADVIGPREILVDHANWLNKGNIHRMTPVYDVSAANDWSAVRVWYIPGRQLGQRVYPAEGFIHPDGTQAAL
ncbi:MAG TPA: CHAP domain-containing protein [Kiloniellaceae bacterium]|nr:CHAP domain-containing protein [Kiloniellaceae bacterium]